MKKLLLLSTLVVLILTVGCKKEEGLVPEPTTPTTPTPPITSEWGSSIQTDIAGSVLDESGQAMSGVSIQVGSATATTDVNGAFYISNATVYENLGYVTASSPGYFPGSRTFLPTTGTDVVNIRMLAKNSAGSIAATTGGALSLEGVNISFTANTFEQNSAIYTGNVNVVLNFIDPESIAFADEMPGTLLGMQNSASNRLTSFGMVAVELSDNSGNEVTLTSGSTAELRFPVATTLLSSAPADIDLWYFNETTGLWESEGTATLQGSEYVANVSHFSFWNCDYGGPYINLDGQVTDPNGIGIQGARVTITSTTQGNETDYTNSAGYFGGYVPSGEVLDIMVELDCDGTGYQIYYTGQIGPFSSATTLPVITVVQGALVLVTGTVTDCNNNPLIAGYVVANGQTHFLSGGTFSFMDCGSSVSITPCSSSPWVGGQAVTVTLSGSSVNAGTLQVCNTGGGGGLAIGDSYQGGIIFYLDGNGGGLIAAPSDQSTGAEWGCYATLISGADGTAIGTGNQNTIDIVNANCWPNTVGNSIAANLCANLTLGGYSDWFLPSIDELSLMYQNIGQGNALGLGNVGGFAGNIYWSSTESVNANAWGQSFNDGYLYSSVKNFSSYVRAIRAF